MPALCSPLRRPAHDIGAESVDAVLHIALFESAREFGAFVAAIVGEDQHAERTWSERAAEGVPLFSESSQARRQSLRLILRGYCDDTGSASYELIAREAAKWRNPHGRNPRCRALDRL